MYIGMDNRALEDGVVDNVRWRKKIPLAFCLHPCILSISLARPSVMEDLRTKCRRTPVGNCIKLCLLLISNS